MRGHEVWSPNGPTTSSSSGQCTTTASDPHHAKVSGGRSARVSNSESCFEKSGRDGEGRIGFIQTAILGGQDQECSRDLNPSSCAW
jgi:hypothetical protein